MGVDGRHDASLKKIVHEDRCVGLVVYEREREREREIHTEMGSWPGPADGVGRLYSWFVQAVAW